jgi:putative drug exporter of the RND superfamily
MYRSDALNPSPRVGWIGRVAAWAIGHRRLVIAGWIIALVVAMGASHAAKPNYINDLTLNGTDSQQAITILHRAFASQAGDLDQIVVSSPRADVADPATQRRVEALLRRVRALPHVTAVGSPYGANPQGLIAADRHTAFATVRFDQPAEQLNRDTVQRVIDTAKAARVSGLDIQLGGRGIEQANRPSLGAATAIGLVAAMAILLFTFGSLLAAALPILTALLGLGTALGLVGLQSHIVHTPDFATQLAALLGLGVGIDYALFVVTRFREALRTGVSAEEAVIAAMDTAGRAVLFAGLTVVIALAGMFVLRVSILSAAAFATGLSVLLTMSAALTALPVALASAGTRLAPRKDKGAGLWPRWATFVTRRPWAAMAAGLALMVPLTIPAFSLRLGQSDAGNDAAHTTTRHAYDQLAHAFGPGFNGPLEVVAQRSPSGADPQSALAAALHKTPGIRNVSGPLRSSDGKTLVYQAFAASSPQSKATTDLVHQLRDNRLPAVERATGTRILVGGSTATGIDFSTVLARRLVLFIAAVIVLAALLLTMVFRSAAVPAQAAVMNVLSVGAALGVAVAVFQHGWLSGLVGVRAGPIEPFIPVILFAIVFGLSMDYEVFLISRIHERLSEHGDSKRALVEGLGSTGRVVTAAAAIMVCVFVSFVLGDVRIVKLFGLGLASAVLLDAFVVRSLLLPAFLALMGDRAWTLPAVVERRLPRLAVEAPSTVD